MYARRRSTRRRPSRNSERSPPVTQIANNCNPTISRNLDYSYFRNSILPVAIANNWIDISATPVLNEITRNIPDDSQVINLPPNCVGFNITQITPRDGELTIDVENSSGSTVSLRYSAQGASFRIVANPGYCNALRDMPFEYVAPYDSIFSDYGYLTKVTSNDFREGDQITAYYISIQSSVQSRSGPTLFVNPTKSSLIRNMVTSH